MSEPRTKGSFPASWRRFIPTLAIVGLLALAFLFASADIRNWFFSPLEPTLDWTNENNNAGAVQAFTAILQAIGTLALLALTWHAIDSSRRIADRAQKQAAEEATRARDHELKSMADSQRQATLSTLPVIAFLDPKSEKTLIEEVSIRMVNVGTGPALFTIVELSDPVIPFQLDRAGEAITLRAGEEAKLTLTTDEDDELRWVIKPDKEWNEYGHDPLATLTARCHDIRGNAWESKAALVWDPVPSAVRFGVSSFSHPD